MSATPRFVCIGAANLDHKLRLDAALQVGTSNPVRPLGRATGGVAFNLASAIASAGAPVALVSPLGDDEAGRWLLHQAQARGIDTRACLRLADQATGSYTAVLKPDGELALALSDMALFDALPETFWHNAEQAVQSAQAVVLDLNLPQAGLQRLCRHATAAQRRLALVAVSVPKMNRLPCELNGVDLLLLNRDELAALLPGHSLNQAWAALQARGLRGLLVTGGAEGLWLATPQHEPLHQACPARRQATDVTGAGDALAATVLHAHWVNGLPLTEAAAQGQRAAQPVLTTTASTSQST
ncbi:MAG: pseudouridine-5-phosphate glycosidase [Comamonadaceae bacterium]|nr:pseudouridine-5-phosphate glycosidase [Comamonadaceae bacterium]